jgi:hypothetical protein
VEDPGDLRDAVVSALGKLGDRAVLGVAVRGAEVGGGVGAGAAAESVVAILAEEHVGPATKASPMGGSPGMGCHDARRLRWRSQ